MRVSTGFWMSAQPWAAVVGVAVGVALLCAAPGRAGAAPSFDCKAAATPVEKAICADSRLAEADQEIADLYRKLIGLSAAAEKERLRADQRGWVARRNQCAAAGPCLSEALDARRQTLAEAMPKAVAGVAAIVDGIATDPAEAGRRLADLREGLAKGWSAYLLRYGPAPDRAKAAALLREAVGGITDSFARETALAGDLADDTGFLTALRVVSDDYEMAWPCSVMRRRGMAAWKAVGPLYGSNRDNFGALPDCDASGALLASPEWKAVEDHLAPMLAAAAGRSGTMRFATFRQMTVNSLISAVDPALLAVDAPALAPLLAETAGWSNPRWVDRAWAGRLRAAVDAAVTAWTPALAARPGVGAAKARRVAEAVAATGMAGSVGMIKDALTLQGDSRLPEWLRGSWTWSGEAAGTPFAVPTGRATIDATGVCAGTECEGFDIAEQGDAVTIDVKAVKALGVTLAPDAATRAVRLASDTTGGSFDAFPLPGGNALVVGYDKPTVLKRAAN